MAQLTAASTVFLPLTFPTGIYRMNFDYMPESEWPYRFYAILALALYSGLGCSSTCEARKSSH